MTLNTRLLASLSILLAASSYAQAPEGKREKLYDFDEKVHYYQTKLADKRYRLEVVADDYQHFQRQSVFLLRHARKLCRTGSFKILVFEGVQEYDRFPTNPRAYEPNLLTEIQCD
ncbi:hypothetical protein [Pseudoalteromonas sp. T1lg75]|uniref:hypothetical protein n=1 Tax=Pseudoalteromonas sp. T1lg75 TaxID=2077102 RepID=UPI000CF6E39E|nr:hypothetical protein [Pseudoalteromonas sp. T1lg75]